MSSSAQLTLLPWLAGWDPPPHRTTHAAGLHAGSCAGIVWALRRDVRRLTRRDVVLVAGTSAPAAVLGLVASGAVEARLGTRRQLAALLAAGGVLLWAADRRPTDRSLGGAEAAAAAVAQVLALAPGVSRSGASLTALRLLRVDRAEAQRLSLLMSVPITAGAAGLTLLQADRDTMAALTGPLCVGVPVAALAAAAAATTVQRRTGGVPVGAACLYRLVLAAVVVRRLRTGAAA